MRLDGQANPMQRRLVEGFILILLILGPQGCSLGTPDAPEVANQPSPSSAPSAGQTRVRPSDSMTMLYVPAGEFRMGSDYLQTADARQLCRDYYTADWPAVCTTDNFRDESPAHMVRLSGFWIDSTEVTNAQYQLCDQAGICDPPAEESYFDDSGDYGDPAHADYPVIWITRDQAAHYCTWTGARLPTEAQWEYAARGPQALIFPWGNEFDGTRLNYCDSNCAEGPNDPTVDDSYACTSPVGSYPSGASWVGALDMAGNVREWVADWYGYYTPEAQVDPRGPAAGEGVVPHGGSWLDLPFLIRSANRGGDPPDYSRHNVGFRCALAD